MTKVSVIIPVYNAERYLKECLDSVINQTLKDIEIICVNDGSTDNSLNIINDYALKDKRIIVINQKNKGISAARNTAVSIARGEFIGFIDSDDWIDSDFYEKLYDVAIKSQADIAVASIIRKRENYNDLYYVKIKKERLTSNKNKKFKFCNIPKRNYVMNKLYRRDNYLNMNISFEEGLYYEDIYWTPRVIYGADKLVTVPSINYYYRYNHNSVVRTTEKWNLKDEKYVDFMLQILKAFKFIKDKKLKVDYRKFPGIISIKISFKNFSVGYYKLCNTHLFYFCDRLLIKIFNYNSDIKYYKKLKYNRN